MFTKNSKLAGIMCIRILGSDPKQIAYIRVRSARLRTAGWGQKEAGVPGGCSSQVKTWRRAAGGTRLFVAAEGNK